jgi:hypothetical protein
MEDLLEEVEKHTRIPEGEDIGEKITLDTPISNSNIGYKLLVCRINFSFFWFFFETDGKIASVDTLQTMFISLIIHEQLMSVFKIINTTCTSLGR